MTRGYEEEKTALLLERSQLGNQKKDAELVLQTIKNEIRRGGQLPKNEYSKLVNEQMKYMKTIREIERKLSRAKDRLREIAGIEGSENRALKQQLIVATYSSAANDQYDTKLRRQLCELRQFYREFAADATRVSSLRHMATDFSLRLDAIIKQSIKEASHESF